MHMHSHTRPLTCLIAVLLVAGAAGGITAAAGLDWHPNAKEHALIADMQAGNITYAYTGYWNANIITYLSGEQVIVRPVAFADNSTL